MNRFLLRVDYYSHIFPNNVTKSCWSFLTSLECMTNTEREFNLLTFGRFFYSFPCFLAVDFSSFLLFGRELLELNYGWRVRLLKALHSFSSKICSWRRDFILWQQIEFDIIFNVNVFMEKGREKMSSLRSNVNWVELNEKNLCLSVANDDSDHHIDFNGIYVLFSSCHRFFTSNSDDSIISIYNNDYFIVDSFGRHSYHISHECRTLRFELVHSNFG